MTTALLDTEGEPIPSEEDGSSYKLFNADLCDWGDGTGPFLSVNVPMYFETEDGVYNSGGVVGAPIQVVLEDYVIGLLGTDGGDGAIAFSAWLRDYADRLEATAKAAAAAPASAAQTAPPVPAR